MTRAKHELIIVTTRITKLCYALARIEYGSHNDEDCQKFESQHEEYYGIHPTPCQFIDNPIEISELLETRLVRPSLLDRELKYLYL